MADILFLAHRVPYPPDRGDKIRGFHILKHLSTRHRVHLIAFADDTRDLTGKAGLAPFTGNRSIIWRSKSRLVSVLQALVARKPFSLTAFDNAPFRESVENMLARHSIDTIYLYSGQMAQYLPARMRQRVIMDFCDVDSAKFEDYGRGSRWPIRWLLRREGRLLGSFERSVAKRADASLFISEDEAAIFRARTGAERVHVIGNGIDTTYYDPAASFKRIETLAPLVVFTGQMDYRPNVEGVIWFVETVFPHIRVRHPEARFAIVGRAPTEAVRALAKEPGVSVTGEVADVRGWLQAAAVVVAPLKLARGVQNKVLEAMAMARPVVATTAAAKGVDHGGTIRVGETVGEIAEAINDLIADRRAADALGLEARAQVQERYSWAAQLAPLDGLLSTGTRSSRNRSAV